MLRAAPPYRRDAFTDGLRAVGYTVHAGPPADQPQRGDVLVIWNRYGHNDTLARRFEDAGADVLVAENGYLGADWRGSHWYALARNHHNGGGVWRLGAGHRWDGWNVHLAPWRADGGHVLILPQRGIGPPGVAMPRHWLKDAVQRVRAMTRRRIVVREHPADKPAARSLAEDLAGAWCAVTWGSGAAIKALLAGVPVFYDFPRWIGAPAAAPLGGDIETPRLGDRLPMLRGLAWAMWSLEEISAGAPFRQLLR